MASKILARLSQALQNKRNAVKPSGLTDLSASRKTFGIGALVDSRYQLVAEIGRGGMGIVYRAHDIPNDREIALKIINLTKANALSLQQFTREAEITSRLKHPHIVNVYETGMVDTGMQQPSPYIAMELVQGKGLDEFHGFTYSRIIDIVGQICEALAYAHNEGIVHRDLKPGNVLVEKYGFLYHVKLMDFGLARPLGAGNLPAESNLAGTIFYLAPEVIAGGTADVSSDLYALGAMLYEMITGRVPFSDFIDDQAILTQHLVEAVPPPSHSRGDVPPALEGIVMRLLEKDPKDRFGSVQEVQHALNRVKVRTESGTIRGNLPPFATDPGNYEKEIAQVIKLLETDRLVTIIGEEEPLALAIAVKLADHFPDGAWMVDLALLDDPASVLPVTASILCVPADSQHALAVSLIECLREKHILLLLRHCDHVLGACAQLANTILRSCSEVYILATSLRPLNLAIEKCYQPSNDSPGK